MSNIHINIDSFKKGFPKEMPVPPLLLSFSEWVKNIPRGTLGYFDAIASEPMPEAFLPNTLDKNTIETICSKLGIFLYLGDGSMVALWNYDGQTQAVVLIGSEGELDNAAPSLESFLIALSKGKTGIDDLDDEEASASRSLLTQWLVEQKVKAVSAKVPDFQEWFASFESQPATDLNLQKDIVRKQTIDKNANYKECNAWIDLFGRTGDDPEVKDALAKVGIKQKVKVNRDESNGGFDIEDIRMTIVFANSSFLYSDKKSPFKPNTPILSGVLMILRPSKLNKCIYIGVLPYNLKLEDSQTILRKRFGKPIKSDEDFCWDCWKLNTEGLELTVEYEENYQSISRISIDLPGSN